MSTDFVSVRDLSMAQWASLLDVARASKREIYIRDRQRGGSQHLGHGVLISTLPNSDELVIKPDTRHRKKEIVARRDVNLWWSKTVNNPSGGIPEAALLKALEEAAQMAPKKVVLGKFSGEEVVCMDVGSLTFYAGYECGKPVFTEELSRAEVYERIAFGNRAAGRFNHNEKLARSISETGVMAMTVKEVWAVRKNAERYEKEHGGRLRLRTLEEVGKPNPAAAAIYLEGVHEAAPTGKPVNLTPPEKRTNGHSVLKPESNGHSNGHGGRLSGLLDNPLLLDRSLVSAERAVVSSVQLPVLTNEAISAATRACEDADAEVASAMQILQEALSRKDRAYRVKEQLLTQAAMCGATNAADLLQRIEAMLAAVPKPEPVVKIG